MKSAHKYFDKIVLILFIVSSSLWTGQSLHAQSDYYLDTIADFRIDFTPGNDVKGTKYYYNNDKKVSKIVTDEYIWNFSYQGNTTTELIEVFVNGPYTIKYESIYNDEGKLLVRNQYEDAFLSIVDSFFYENDKLSEQKRYQIWNGNPLEIDLVSEKVYSYNSANLVENTVGIHIDYSPFNSWLRTTENYHYDQNFNLISWVRTELELDTGESSEESKYYTYNSDQKVDTLKYFTEDFLLKFDVNTYVDSTHVQDLYTLTSSSGINYYRWFRTETYQYQHDYFSFDSLLFYLFNENGDSILTTLETNHKDFLSFVSDTLLHRNSVTNFDAIGEFSSQEITKSYYVKNPEITGISKNSLPTFTINPNPVLRGSLVRIPDLEIDYDQVAMYSLDGRSTQFLNIDQYNRHFNAPQEKGMYLVQLWNNKQAVTQVVKITVQ